MDLIIALISIDVIASKFLDVYITSNRTETIQRRQNPILKIILEKAKIEHDNWLSFFCCVFVVGTAVYLLNSYFTATSFQLLYIFTGLFTTTLNLGSAHSSYFGKKNFISRKLLRS